MLLVTAYWFNADNKILLIVIEGSAIKHMN